MCQGYIKQEEKSILRKFLKNYLEKTLEKSGNFVSPKKWEP